ncbi:MAG: DEAD/DEAH box helicase, partial [Solirubrobacterales bacterium]|nr:DEAD/DEAH box helicase [Solirubrobacterales bacterium]
NVAGRWSLAARLFDPDRDISAHRRALAELLLERYGVLTREQVLAEGVPGGFSALYPALGDLETLGVARRGYFVEGLGGAQFALAGAVERLREGGAAGCVVLSAADPAQPYGAVLPWPSRSDSGRGPARVGGAYVVLSGGDPILYLERGGRGLLCLVDLGDPRVADALRALVGHLRDARRRVALEKVNGEPALGSPLGSLLIEAGFEEGPRRLTLSA